MEEDLNSGTGIGMNKQKILNIRKLVAQPKTGVMVMEAVAELNGKGGVSLRRIKKYMRKVHEVDTEKRAHSIQKAITKAVANGQLIQTMGSGTNGSFRLTLPAQDAVEPSNFKSELNVEKNSRTENEGMEFQYECGFCGSSFSSFDLRTEHTKKVHSHIHKFPCKYCGQLFLSEIKLYTHLVNHSESAEEKLFKCHVCNGGFSKKKQLRKHLKFFHGEKANKNEGDEQIPYFRLMIIGALEFHLDDPRMYHGVTYEVMNRTVQETFNVKTECLDELNEMVREGILGLSGDRTYSKNSLDLYWSNQNIKVGPGDLNKARRGNSGTNRKRRSSVTNEDGSDSKRMRPGFPSHLRNESGQDLCGELDNAYQTRQYRNQLIGLMYGVELSVLCSLRKLTNAHKYPSLKLRFDYFTIGNFNVVLRNRKKSIHIQTENVDKHYTDNNISYAKLFAKDNRRSSINYYLDNFVKHVISKSDNSLNDIQYFIIYTNSGLNLTDENKLIEGRSKNFYPFKFHKINLEECEILKDFLFTNENTKGSGFYQFLQDQKTREELLKRLEFSSAMQKVIQERNIFEKEMKEEFVKKLVFAVNQPNREELNSIVTSEIEKNSPAQYEYTVLQKEVLRNLTGPKKPEEKLVSGILYEFNLLMSFLHDIFLHENMFSIGNSRDACHDFIINYKDTHIYVKAESTDSTIGYSHLFPTRAQQSRNKFSINNYFNLFIEELEKKKNIKYFIIYTNADLDLTEDKKFKKGRSKDSYPLEFDGISIEKNKYKILRHFSCVEETGLYKFAREETTRKKVLSLLRPSFESENEKEIKKKFLDRLIFSVNQPNREEVDKNIEMEIDKSNQSNKISYNYKDLHEIALRWLESHELGPITKGIMERLFEDVTNNRFSCHKKRNIDEEIKFARTVVGREGTTPFNHFLEFLIKGEGKNYLEVLKRNGVNLASVSSILCGAGANASKAFVDLYTLWFDVKGNKTPYLKSLESKGISLARMSSILSRAGASAAKAYKELYNIWFDVEGNETQCLETLEKQGVNLASMSSILSRAGNNAGKAFKELYDFWFDKQGNKTQYLKILEKERVNLTNISSILHGAAANAAKAFKNLYDLWFDDLGKTSYLKALEEAGINLCTVSSILNGAGSSAANAFKELYDLWFDEEGNQKKYLKRFLKKTDFSMHNLSGILSRSEAKAKDSFVKLYSLFLNDKGKKTKLLHDFYNADFGPGNLSCMLSGAGPHTSSIVKRFHTLCFDHEGERTELLVDFCEAGFRPGYLCNILSAAADRLEEFHDFCFIGETKKYLNRFLNATESFTPNNLCNILHGARANLCSAFKDFCGICFDGEGKKTEVLDEFSKEGFKPHDLSNILSMAGNNASSILRSFHKSSFNTKNYLNHFLTEEKVFRPKDLSKILHGVGINISRTFEKLHGLCFDGTGNRTKYLENLIENNSRKRKEIIDILYQEVRKGRSSHFLR